MGSRRGFLLLPWFRPRPLYPKRLLMLSGGPRLVTSLSSLGPRLWKPAAETKAQSLAGGMLDYLAMPVGSTAGL